MRIISTIIVPALALSIISHDVLAFIASKTSQLIPPCASSLAPSSRSIGSSTQCLYASSTSTSPSKTIDVNDWAAVEKEIFLYLDVKKKMNLPPLHGNDGRGEGEEQEVKDDKLAETVRDAASMTVNMFRPTGWYKDVDAIEMKKRTDSRMPRALHPLSYIEMQRHGFQALGDAVMTLGGPYIIGAKIGLEWEEPVEIFDESLRSVRIESYALDSRGQLLLGGALGSKLEADAAALDMASLKKEIENRNRFEENEDAGMDTFVSSSSQSLVEGEEYNNIAFRQKFSKQIGKKARAKWMPTEEKVIPKGERFVLDSGKRLYLSLVVATFSLAHGHTSMDVIDKGIGGEALLAAIAASNFVSSALLVSSVMSTVLSMRSAQEKNRNTFVWAMKGLLGGPLTVRELSSLPPLQLEKAKDL